MGSKRVEKKDEEYRKTVIANQDKVIKRAKELPKDDKSDHAEYTREVAADIIARRAADN
jgi:hypothetical protein